VVAVLVVWVVLVVRVSVLQLLVEFRFLELLRAWMFLLTWLDSPLDSLGYLEVLRNIRYTLVAI
jgi:hypothetical protein